MQILSLGTLGKKVFQKHLVSKYIEVVKYFPLDCDWALLSFRLYPFIYVNAIVLVSRTNYKGDKVQLDKMRKSSTTWYLEKETRDYPMEHNLSLRKINQLG